MKVYRQYRDAVALLAGFRRRKQRANLLLWLLVTLGVLLLLTTGVVLWERFDPGSTATRQFLLKLSAYSWLAGAVLLLGRAIYFQVWCRRRPDDLTLAGELGLRDDDVRDRLLNALQLHSSPDSQQLFSSELIDQALVQIVPELPRDTKRLIPRHRQQLLSKLLSALVALQVLLLLFQWSPLLQAGQRLLQPERHFTDPRLISVTLVPGDTTLVRGSDLLIRATTEGGVIPEHLQLTVNRGGEKFLYPMRGRGGSFSLLLERIHTPLTYHIEGEHLQSNHGEVRLLDRPVVTDLQIELTYPAYTGLLPLELDRNIGSFSAIYSSVAHFAVSTSKPSGVQLVMDNGSSIDLIEMDGRYLAELVVREDCEYHIHLVDDDSLTNQDPISWQITAVADSYPVLNLVTPRDGEQVTRQVSILASGVDDFGITRFQLRYRLVPPFLQPEYRDFQLGSATAGELAEWTALELPFEQLEVGEALLDYSWILHSTDALPEDEILLFVTLWDNDSVSGPKWVRSPLLRLNLPGTAELFSAVQEREEVEMERAGEIIERSRENLEELERLATELRVDPEQMDWELQRQVENIAREQLELAESAGEIQQQLEQLQQSLEENQLFSEEVMEKIQQLNELLQEVMTDEMKALLEQLREGQEPTPEQVQEAMERARQELDLFLEQMERLLAILEQLQLEQKLEELARRAEELRQQQEQLNEQAGTANPPPNLDQQQEQLANATEQLQNDISSTREQFSENRHLPDEQLVSASAFMEEQALTEQMMQNAGQLSSDPSEAVPAGEEIAGDLGQLQQILQDASSMAAQSAMADLNRAIDRAVHRLLVISGLAENLHEDVTGLRPENSSFNRCAFQQLSLTGTLLFSIEEVAELMMKSFFISRSALAFLQEAALLSEQSVRDFEERRLHNLPDRETRILAGVNRAVYTLLQNQESMNSSSSSTGFEEMMEQLMQCSSEQQSINSQCNKLMSAQQGQCEKPVGVSLSDMAERQARLRQQMEQLGQQVNEMSGGRQPLGDLGEIASQMQEVEEQLRDRQFTERTLRLQERILNQLLDSQRSIREREQSQERESRTATPIDRTPPGELLLEMTPDDLRQEMMRALREGYSREYLELIRSYYQQLMLLEENSKAIQGSDEAP